MRRLVAALCIVALLFCVALNVSSADLTRAIPLLPSVSSYSLRYPLSFSAMATHQFSHSVYAWFWDRARLLRPRKITRNCGLDG